MLDYLVVLVDGICVVFEYLVLQLQVAVPEQGLCQSQPVRSK